MSTEHEDPEDRAEAAYDAIHNWPGAVFDTRAQEARDWLLNWIDKIDKIDKGE
jgi:hypothetical protein